MSAITATPDLDAGTVTLNATGMPVLGSRWGTYGTASGFGVQSGTTISDTAGDTTYGANVAVTWNSGQTSYLSVTQNKGTILGNYYAFRFLVRLDPATPGVPGQVHPPVEVWLDTTGETTSFGKDKTSRQILWQKSTEDPDPYGYTEFWLFFQAVNASETVYLRARPLYPHTTSIRLYFKYMQFYNVDTGGSGPTVRRTTPRIFRTDANGRRELEVPFLPPPPPATTLTTTPVGSTYGPLVDREAALEGTVTYELIDVSGGVNVHASTTTTLDTPDDLPVASVSSNVAGAAASVDLVTNYTGDRVSTGRVHVVVDRADPVVVTGPAGLRTGTLELFTDDRASAEAVVDVLRAGHETLLRTRNGMDVRFVPQRVTDRPAEVGEDLWSTTVDYVEVP